jgi:hypothetical protein
MTKFDRKTLKAMGLETLGMSKKAYLNHVLVNRTIRECRKATRLRKQEAQARRAQGSTHVVGRKDT